MDNAVIIRAGCFKKYYPGLYLILRLLSPPTTPPVRAGLGTSSSFAAGMLNVFYAFKGKYAEKNLQMRQFIMRGGYSMDTAIRIAQIIGKMCAGGVESVVFNYYRATDYDKYEYVNTTAREAVAA